MTDPTFIAAIVVAGLLVGISKSGLAVSVGAIAVPLLTLVMPARDAAGALLPVLLAVDLVALALYARRVDKRILMILIPGSLIGTLLGWLLSATVDEHAVRFAIGIVTFVFVIDAWFPLRKKLEGLPPSRGWGTFWGAVTGFTSFISHTGGPPYQIFTLPQKLAPAVFAGTTAVFFSINNMAKLVPYYFLGQLQASNLMLSAMMIPVALVAMAAGYYLVKRISPKLFYNMAYALLLLFSIKLIWDGIAGFFAAPVVGA